LTSKVIPAPVGAATGVSDGENRPAAPTRANILVVDDHPDKLLVLQTILEDLHENVVTVRSGREALKSLLEDEFAVILLDVKMPEMDGFETAKLIRGRRQFAHTPIIFVTAYEDEMRTAEGYSLGAVDYILTPIVPEVLRSKVSVFVQLFHLRNQIERQADERIALMREQAAREVAEASIRRSVLLAEASRVLSSSLDVVATAQGLTRFVVPTLAEMCALTLVDESGDVRRTELAWARGGGTGPVDQVSAVRVADAPLAAGIARALQTGETEWIDLPMPEVTIEVEPLPVLELGFPLRHATIFPLHARGRRLGVLVMGSSTNSMTSVDRALAADLAGRTAIALDNAMLYSKIQEADRRKDEFLAMLAHELRNPLAPIRNALSVLRLSTPQEGIAKRSQGIIDRQVEQLTRIVDDLLDVSRLTHGKIRLEQVVVDLAQVLDRALETVRPLITDRRHVLTMHLPNAPVPVCGDPVRLAQVFSNLLSNAAKYTPENGRIVVDVQHDGAQVTIRVADDGGGIPADVLPHVFDLFTQGNRSLARSEGGLGIGLTVVRTLLEKHGGSVDARSGGAGLGSEFTVRLPMATTRVLPPVAVADGPESPEAIDGIRVLLVDDNADANEALEALLVLDGQDVRCALDGQTALAIARDWQPHLVLCDLGLPGMDGYEVIRVLRQQTGDVVPVVAAVTGYARAEDKLRTREAGFDHHLAKPVALEALRDLLASVRRSENAYRQR
jgi:signal transduction histidine kinase/DNA-binding response OmpR family regulator